MQKEHAIDIKELRIKLDQINEQIIIGLKNRSRYPLNSNTFTEEFAEMKSWFEYRLKKDQDVDAEFGRFLYNDQSPLGYTKEELAKPLIKTPAKSTGIKQVRVEVLGDIVSNYREILAALCKHKEDRGTYGATTKLDVENILLYNERIVGLGEQVAGYKMRKNPKLAKITSREELRKRLVIPKREEEVVNSAVTTAKKYGITQSGAIKKFIKRMINITTKVEMRRIIASKKK